VNPNRRTNETEQRAYDDERRIRRPLRPRAVAPASVIILLFVCRKPVTPLDSTHEHWTALVSFELRARFCDREWIPLQPAVAL